MFIVRSSLARWRWLLGVEDIFAAIVFVYCPWTDTSLKGGILLIRISLQPVWVWFVQKVYASKNSSNEFLCHKSHHQHLSFKRWDIAALTDKKRYKGKKGMSLYKNPRFLIHNPTTLNTLVTLPYIVDLSYVFSSCLLLVLYQGLRAFKFIRSDCCN